MRTMTRISIAAGAAILCAAGAASAQTFTFQAKEDVKAVEWDASAEAGVIVTTGNSQTTTGTAAAKASRRDGNNRFAVEASGTYARSTIRDFTDDDENGMISEDEITEDGVTSAKNAQIKLRYDRFLTEHNSLYASAAAGFDEPAGKDFVGGGQVGYSRQVYKTDRHEVKAELGYDFTYEDLAAVDQSTSIHSARFFAGWKGALHTETDAEGKVTPTTTAEASAEALVNLNPLDVSTGDGEAGFGEDTRLNGTVGLTTKLLDNISLAVSVTAKFDNVPAPAAPFALPYEPGFVPEAEKLDTISKATLIVSFF